MYMDLRCNVCMVECVLYWNLNDFMGQATWWPLLGQVFWHPILLLICSPGVPGLQQLVWIFGTSWCTSGIRIFKWVEGTRQVYYSQHWPPGCHPLERPECIWMYVVLSRIDFVRNMFCVILLVTPCLLTRIREFIHTQHRNCDAKCG